MDTNNNAPGAFQPCHCPAGGCTRACTPEHGGGGPGLVATLADEQPGNEGTPLPTNSAAAPRAEPTPGAWRHEMVRVFGRVHHAVVTDARPLYDRGVVALTGIVGDIDEAEAIANAQLLSTARKLRTLVDEVLEWSCERPPLNYADAELLKAIWTFTGDYVGPCEGCDGECDEPCATSRTIEEAHASIDRSLQARHANEAETIRVREETAERKRQWHQERLVDVVAAAAGATPAARDVMAERARQIGAEGYAPEHDDKHNAGELGLAAALYALPYGTGLLTQEHVLPLDMALEVGCGWTLKPEPDRRKRLVKAGALILAEIERLDRAAQALQQAATEDV